MAIGETRDTNLFNFNGQSFAVVPPYTNNSWSGRSNSICGCWLPSASLYFALPSAQPTTRCICKSHVCRRQTVCFFILKTPRVPPEGLGFHSSPPGGTCVNPSRPKKMQNKPVICITRLLTVGVSPFRRPPVVIHAATIDWHRIGLLLAATIRNIHNGHLICIRISSLRITSRFRLFLIEKNASSHLPWRSFISIEKMSKNRNIQIWKK